MRQSGRLNAGGYRQADGEQECAGAVQLQAGSTAEGPTLAHQKVAWWQATLRMLRTSCAICTASAGLVCCEKGWKA